MGRSILSFATEKEFTALEWLASICSHIPNPGEHTVRYYGYYSNVRKILKHLGLWMTHTRASPAKASTAFSEDDFTQHNQSFNGCYTPAPDYGWDDYL